LTKSSITAVWYWKRSAIPKNINSPDPSTWGAPVAAFTSGSCNIAEQFLDHQIIFDITFCGDWAGQPLGAAACAEAVQNNPGVSESIRI